MILFKIQICDGADAFLEEVHENIHDVWAKGMEAVFLSNLHLTELQKYTTIPLQEITFEELINM